MAGGKGSGGLHSVNGDGVADGPPADGINPTIGAHRVRQVFRLGTNGRAGSPRVSTYPEISADRRGSG